MYAQAYVGHLQLHFKDHRRANEVGIAQRS